MATVNLGSIKFKWKGTYSGATAYTVDDVVEYNGSSYICILASTGNLPTNATYFEQMSQAGTDGTDLTSTLTTQGDLLYRDGSGLQRLGAGTSGQVLQTGGTGANPSWGDVSSELTPAFRATGGSSYPSGISNYTWTLQKVDTVDFISAGGTFDNTAGNYKWTPATAGKYLFNIVIGAYWSTGGRNQTSPFNYGIAIGKNGSAGTSFQYANSFAQNCNCYSGGANLSTIQTANGTSDYFQIYVWSDNGGVSFSTTEFSAFRLIGV